MPVLALLLSLGKEEENIEFLGTTVVSGTAWMRHFCLTRVNGSLF